MEQPKLVFLHTEGTLIKLKLELFRGFTTEVLIASLLPGTPASLKARHDGTVLDGHHRIQVLLERGENVDELPREIIEKSDEP